MALGLIQFLIGGKKKKSSSKSGQVAVSVSKPTTNDAAPVQEQQGVTQIPDGVDTPTQNTPQDSQGENQPSQESTSNPTSAAIAHPHNKKSLSETLMKIHKEIQESNERLTGLVTDVKNVENSVNSLNKRVDTLDKAQKVSEEKFHDIDSSMSKFLSLYELINNQYNPFVSKDDEKPIEMPQLEENTEEGMEENIEENGDGQVLEIEDGPDSPEEIASVFRTDREETLEAAPQEKPKKKVKTINIPHTHISQSLLELDTLNIEEAAADCVPLTRLKNNTNGLVIILSWLEYLIKKVGVDESRNTLRYYTETLRWLTPEVFFDLDKYLRGMNDVSEVEREQANVKDHIVSLYFISKLNERQLDHRLTRAVLEIIQE